MKHRLLPGFTLIELLITVVIITILAIAAFAVFNPQNRIWSAQAQQAVSDLQELSKAIELYAIDTGTYPPEEVDALPAVLGDYIHFNSDWPAGPFPGSIYDYDNLQGQSCADSNANGSVQIRLRNVTERQPGGGSNWVWYHPVIGSGTPECNNASQGGECVSCGDFSL